MVVALDRALDFLVSAQSPSGRLPIGMGLQIDATDDDPSLFATAMVAEAIGACADPRARQIFERAAAHLAGHVERPGVWRHWTAEHPQFHALPADADDTAWAGVVLRQAGRPGLGSGAILLENRDAAGRFRTWLLVRIGQGAPSREMLLVGLRRLARPVHAFLFWRATSADPRDVDGVVNAHVLAYLGPGPHAPAVAAFLTDILRAEAEDRCDKWYRSPYLFYAAVARCWAAGISELDEAASMVERRICASARADGQIGSGPLDTALAMRALAELGLVDDAVIARATQYLASTQDDDGGWPAEPVYFGGPRHHPEVPCWGSRALTTGLCAGALARAS